MLITNNVGGGGQYFAQAGGQISNVVFAANTSSSGPIDSRGVSGNYFIDLPGNNFGIQYGQGESDWTGVTNGITYGLGRFHNITHAASSSLFYLDDSNPGLIPPSAVLQITNSGPANAIVYRSAKISKFTPKFTLSPGQGVNYYWVNGFWSPSLQLPYSPHVIGN